jgi:LAGLIDADG endonuclease
MFTKPNCPFFIYSEKLEKDTFIRQAACNTGLVIKFKDTRQFAGNIKKKYISSETKREAVSNEERWAIGLIDGDGHISMECSSVKLQKWVPCLKVTLHAYNARAIYRLKKILGIGSITRSGNFISLRVRKLDGWKKLFILFEKFPLRTDKYYAVEMVQKSLQLKEQLTQEKKNYLPPFYPEENILNGLDEVKKTKNLSAPDREMVNQCLLDWKQDLKADRGKLSPVWNTLLSSASGPRNVENSHLLPSNKTFLRSCPAVAQQHLCKSLATKLAPQDLKAKDREKKPAGKIVSLAPCIFGQSLRSVFDNCEQPLLEQVVDLNWLAGFIEADGSFYILQNGQHGFAIGQAYNTLVVAGIHKRLNIKASFKIRSCSQAEVIGPYVQSETKDKATLLKIAALLKGKILGIKSFVFSLWLRTLRKNNRRKSQKARRIIKKITQRIP